MHMIGKIEYHKLHKGTKRTVSYQSSCVHTSEVQHPSYRKRIPLQQSKNTFLMKHCFDDFAAGKISLIHFLLDLFIQPIFSRYERAVCNIF